MNTLSNLPILTHSQNLSSIDAEQHAWAVFHEFFSFYEEEHARENFWYMLVAALKSPDEAISPRHRSDMIFFYEYCLAMLRAAHVLHQHKEAGPPPVADFP